MHTDPLVQYSWSFVWIQNFWITLVSKSKVFKMFFHVTDVRFLDHESATSKPAFIIFTFLFNYCCKLRCLILCYRNFQFSFKALYSIYFFRLQIAKIYYNTTPQMWLWLLSQKIKPNSHTIFGCLLRPQQLFTCCLYQIKFDLKLGIRISVWTNVKRA